MFSNDFEESFSKFLETREYDEAENVLFTAMRKAFIAGWLAAGGDPPNEARIFQLFPCGEEKEWADAQAQKLSPGRYPLPGDFLVLYRKASFFLQFPSEPV